MHSQTEVRIVALNHSGSDRCYGDGDGRNNTNFSADEYPCDRGRKVTGGETFPPFIACGVLIDVANAKGLTAPAASYRIPSVDFEVALRSPRFTLQCGYLASILIGRTAHHENAGAYTDNLSGLRIYAACSLIEISRANLVEVDNLSAKVFPTEIKYSDSTVFTCLLSQHGMTILKLANLDELARDGHYKLTFIVAPVKLRGVNAAPMRPIALPTRR